ncbi:MAG TPA: hypothetical protein PLD12_00880 [Bacteroidales bacterium]|nr:hypothetical protein [Bacteroidales bacterium]
MKMEKNYLRFVLLALVLMVVTFDAVYAQDQTVTVGSTYDYSTVVSIMGSSFTWNVTGGTIGTDFSYTPSNTNTQQIQWLQQGTYTIQVTEVSPHGCTNPSAPSSYQVLVVAPATIEFASTSSAACSGAAATDLTLNLSFTGTVVYPIVVNYTIGSNSYSRTINSGTTISLGSEENILVNNTASDVTKVIQITSATSHGAPLTIGTNRTHNYTVYATPQLNPITHN